MTTGNRQQKPACTEQLELKLSGCSDVLLFRFQDLGFILLVIALKSWFHLVSLDALLGSIIEVSLKSKEKVKTKLKIKEFPKLPPGPPCI